MIIKDSKHTRIIVELHDICNRNCHFCIRKLFEGTHYMSDETLDLLLEQVEQNIDLFHQPLIFSMFKYNEPLFDIQLLNNATKKIKDKFSDSYIYFHTNGDYLNSDTINLIENTNTMYVNDYDNTGTVNVLSKIENLGISDIVNFIEIKNERSHIVTKYNDMKIIFYIDSEKDLLVRNKCSTLESSHERKGKCEIKEKILTIETNGDIMACCEGSNKIHSHSDLIVGNIHTTGLKNISSIDEFENSLCKSCDMYLDKCDLYGGYYSYLIKE